MNTQVTTTTVNVQLTLTRKGSPFLTEEQMLIWINQCLNCNTSHVEATVTKANDPSLIVQMDGGLIQTIHANTPARFIVLNEDIEGVGDDEIDLIDEQEVLVSDRFVEVDRTYVDKIQAEVNAR